MRLSVNRKVWLYMSIVAAILFFGISFLFYIKPVFAALVLGGLVTVFLDRLIGLFSMATAHLSSEKRKIAAVLGSIMAVIFILVLAVGGSLIFFNNLNEIIKTFDDFNQQYNNTAEELADELSNMSNDTIFLFPGIEEGFFESDEAWLIQNAPDPPDDTPKGIFGLGFNISGSKIISMILTSGGGFLKSSQGSISVFVSTVFASCLIIPIMVGYYFKSKGKIQSRLIDFVPHKHKDSVRVTLQNIVEDMSAYTMMKMLEVIVITFFYCVGFVIVGLPHGILAGIIVGLFNVVPYVGFILPAIPVVVYAYAVGPEVMMAVIGIMIVLQFIDYFFILPNIVMKTVKVSSFTAVILTLAGLKLFGIYGLVFAVPIYIFCKIVMTSCYKVLIVMYPDPPDPAESVLDEG